MQVLWNRKTISFASFWIPSYQVQCGQIPGNKKILGEWMKDSVGDRWFLFGILEVASFFQYLPTQNYLWPGLLSIYWYLFPPAHRGCKQPTYIFRTSFAVRFGHVAGFFYQWNMGRRHLCSFHNCPINSCVILHMLFSFHWPNTEAPVKNVRL